MINTGSPTANVVHVRHKSNVDVSVFVIKDMYGAFGAMNAYGTKGLLSSKYADNFYAFKTQLVEFISYLRTGRLPFEFSQTVELMKIIIAGIKSREEGGKRVMLDSLDVGTIRE